MVRCNLAVPSHPIPPSCRARKHLRPHPSFSVYLILDIEHPRLGIVTIYLKIPSPELAVARVRGRVKEGGHNVPEADICRRFDKCWTNFCNLCRPLADQWIVFDNSGVRPSILEQSHEQPD